RHAPGLGKFQTRTGERERSGLDVGTSGDSTRVAHVHGTIPGTASGPGGHVLHDGRGEPSVVVAKMCGGSPASGGLFAPGACAHFASAGGTLCRVSTGGQSDAP